MNLALKLPLLVSVVTVAGVGTGAAVIALKAERSFRTEAIEASRHSVAAYGGAIAGYVGNARALVMLSVLDKRLARYATDAGTGAGPLRRRARELLTTSRLFESVMLADAHGRLVVGESRPRQAAAPGRDVSFLGWFKRVVATGRPVISDLHISPVTNAPSVVIAVPLRDASGRTTGVWAAALRLAALSAVGRVTGTSADGGYYGYLTDRRGLVIAHQAKPSYVLYQTDFSRNPPVVRARAGIIGSGDWRSPIDGQDKFGAYTRLPASGWAAVYGTTKRAALAPASSMKTTIVVTGGIVAVVIAALTAAIAHALVRPLKRLLTAADRIGGGDLTASVAAGGSGEVARLGRRFDGMVASLSRRDEELRAQADELRQSNAELDAFTYSVSHDLRAPLRAVDGFSQILVEEHAADLDDEATRYLDRVRGGAQDMGLLIDDLLRLSRVGRAELRPEPVDLSDLAQDIAAELARAEPDRAVSLTIAPGLSARGDPRLLRVALTNLLSNAWKFTGATPDAEIEVGAGPEPGSFFVRDNGAGFDMAYADKLFQPFQRLHRVSEFPGTGIGLATTRRVIGRHGGRIWARSLPGRETVFSFTLALTPTPSANGTSITAPEEAIT